MSRELMIVTDRRATGGRDLVDVIRRSLEGGARTIQLREKDLSGRPLLELARRLRELTRESGARLLVNDRIDVALAANADGVVLPAASVPTTVARRLLGPGRIVARSTHSPSEVRKAHVDGCDFALFGPVFETPSKAPFGPPQGLDRLREAASVGIPIVGVGGITPENARAVMETGAAGIAVIRAVVAADDPASVVRALLEKYRPSGV